MGCEFELFEGKIYIRRRSYRLKMNLKNSVVETVIYLFFLVYKLDLAVGFFEIFGKNFSLLYHWILFIACLHDNIIRYFNIDDGYFIFLEEIYNARK